MEARQIHVLKVRGSNPLSAILLLYISCTKYIIRKFVLPAFVLKSKRGDSYTQKAVYSFLTVKEKVSTSSAFNERFPSRCAKKTGERLISVKLLWARE